MLAKNCISRLKLRNECRLIYSFAMKLESQHRSALICAITAALSCAPVLTLGQAAAPSRAATVFDSMPQAKQIDQAAISSDGTQVAYIVGGELTVTSASGGPGRTIAVEGKLGLREVTWSTDSKQIAFLADLPGDTPSAQVWTAAIDGSAPIKRAELKGNVADPRFSPDGSRLAVLFIEGLPRIAGPLQPMTPLAGVIDDKTYEQRLAIIDLSSNALTQVTPADVYVYEYDWTPDGQAWVASAAHGAGDANWYIARLYRINAQSGEMREIYAPKWQIAEPRVSPDGKTVAFIEGLMSDEGSTGGDVYAVSIAGGTARNLTPNIKASPSSLAWTDTGQITFAENVDGKSGFGTVSASGGEVKMLWSGEEFVGTDSQPSASFSRDGTMTAVVRQSASTPPEVWTGSIGAWKQVSSVNAGLRPAWGEIRNFHWMNGRTRVQGWLMLPKNFAPGKNYPLVVNVHGGPSSACSSHWDARVLGSQSAMGYFAFCPNPRGHCGMPLTRAFFTAIAGRVAGLSAHGRHFLLP